MLVLIHGYSSSCDAWSQWLRTYSVWAVPGKKGQKSDHALFNKVFVYRWPTSSQSNVPSLPAVLTHLESELRRVRISSHGTITIVAHSTGGALAWQAVSDMMAARQLGTVRLITMGAPFNGASIANSAPLSPQRTDLLPGSPFARATKSAAAAVMKDNRVTATIFCEGNFKRGLKRFVVAPDECRPADLPRANIAFLIGDHADIREPVHPACPTFRAVWDTTFAVALDTTSSMNCFRKPGPLSIEGGWRVSVLPGFAPLHGVVGALFLKQRIGLVYSHEWVADRFGLRRATMDEAAVSLRSSCLKIRLQCPSMFNLDWAFLPEVTLGTRRLRTDTAVRRLGVARFAIATNIGVGSNWTGVILPFVEVHSQLRANSTYAGFGVGARISRNSLHMPFGASQ